jgi:uncharacterized OB-fold protein
VPAPNAERLLGKGNEASSDPALQRRHQRFFYPRFFCPKCLSKNVEWFKTSGKGKLHTYMINHRAPPAFMAEAPYAIAIVELDEGPKMMTNIHGIENTPEKLVLDMPLKVVFEEIAPGRKVPYWTPA